MMTRRNLLPDLLKDRSITIYGLARETKMPYHNVSRIVSAATIPDGTHYKTLRKIARVLAVGIDELESEG